MVGVLLKTQKRKFISKCNYVLLCFQGDKGDKGDRGLTTTLSGDKFPTGIIEGPPGPPGPPGNKLLHCDL